MSVGCTNCGHMPAVRARFCPECGSAMPALPLSRSSSRAFVVECPECGETRRDASSVCRNCRYDFLDGKPFNADAVSLPEASDATLIGKTRRMIPLLLGAPASSAENFMPSKLRLTVLHEATDAFGAALPPASRTFEVSVDSKGGLILEVGRGSLTAVEGCRLSLADHGVSRRHCSFRVEDRKVVVGDVGSTNGTEVMGADSVRTTLVPNGSERFLSSGEAVVLGAWTTLRVEIVT